MAKNFSKFLGKVALMTAAALWAACNDFDKKADGSSVQDGRAERAIQTVKVYDEQKPVGRALEKVEQSADSSPSADTLASESEFAESSASDSAAVMEPAKDSLLKKAVRVAKMKPEIGMIRALYGVIEEDMGRAVALYGVRPPREIIMPDGPREIHQPRPVARCYVKELIKQDVVVGEGGDIDVQTLLKVFRQRSPGIRHICNKNIYNNVKNRAERTKEFEGKIDLTLKIAPSGVVENVEIKSSTVAFGEEIKKSVSRWRFPKTQNGGAFTFPVNLYEVIPSVSSSASEQPLPQTKD